MSTSLEGIKPETVARLAMLAKETGLSVDDYLKRLLGLNGGTPAAPRAELTSQERVKLWRDWVENHSVKGVTADDSRESIYTREDEAL